MLYALGQVNFLSDRATPPTMTMGNLSARFGVASSTAGSKAKLVRKSLGMHPLDQRWMLPSILATHTFSWMIEFNGFIIDARQLPIEV